MKFPRPFKLMPNGCIAVVAKVSGPRKVEGPVLKGRPATKHEGENWKSSRLSYHLNKGELPRTPLSLKEGIVLHSCDNEWCINPEHLSLGTQKRNQKEMYERSPTVKSRMSLAKRGNQNAKGKKWTDEQRAAHSERLKGNKNKLGKKQKPKSEQARENHRRVWTPEKREEQRRKMMGNTYRRDHNENV